MKIGFRTPRLERQCRTRSSRQRAFGQERGRRLGARLSALVAAENLEELRNAPGRLHELKGDRKGQLSLDLDGPYRLILEPVLDSSGGRAPSWAQITHVRIHSIEDTHA